MFVIDMFTSPTMPSGYMIGITLISMLLLYQTIQIVYNLYLHPLRSFPGPLSQRASKIPWAIQHVLGTEGFKTQKSHEKYGPVVRISPNHLAFTDPRAWRDIYGHLIGAKHGQPEMVKSPTFSRTIQDIPTNIINAPREEHSRFRRALSHGFSDSSMRQQEPVIQRYVDLLMKRLHEQSCLGEKKINTEAYYNWTTFDVTGELVFGMSFGSLDSVEYHPWIQFMIQAVRGGAWLVTLAYLGHSWLVQAMYRYAGRQLAVAKTEKVINIMLENRLNNVEKGRADLFEGLVKQREAWGIGFDKLAANAFILTLAGSETTATTLSGVTYLLLTHPEIMEKVKGEVRGSFKSVEEIDIASVGKLSYMLAVLNESLRMFPPVATGLVRVVPEGGAVIAGVFVPGGTLVEVQHWSINHCEDNWEDPFTFKPERFLEGSNQQGDYNGRNLVESLQAFSVGPRNCIGRNLAYAEMRLILARMLFEFDMTLAKDSHRWIERQKTYMIWDRIPLNVYLTPMARKEDGKT